ncbi:MAG: rhodanese-like domain-containing protein [Candidatus Moranbacteria bacterium]|nr:rhodanese-like domain-containing protein [Candidatus Moranbacteria bacterium]
MSNIEENKNKIVLIGFVLIIVVIVITFTRDSIGNKKKNVDETETVAQPVDETNYLLPKELQQKIIQKEKDLFMIDVRDRESYLAEHIENTINIPMEFIYQEYDHIDKKNTLIIIGADYSDRKDLSELFTFLKKENFEKLYVLSGGMTAWKDSYQPTVSIGNPESLEDIAKVSFLNPAQVNIAIQNDYSAIILDVRSKKDFENGHIRGAINIPADEIEKRKNEISSAKELIMYSESTLKDFQIAVKLYDLGFLATYIIDGGLASWTEKNFELIQ